MEKMSLILAALILLGIIFLITQIIMKPIKLIWKILFNSIVGLLLLLLTNFIGTFFTFALPINIVTVLISGFLGIPGILLLICFELLLV
ncbi:SigmaK-factor processing regulatory BofA [Syntrophomonas zehnderi OL-4]|uniref:SigmaK-factor processing regulatory BofA n=1 Tax=Syntrophomonas zehnderi OL-4 TaxID=690567 RepID=A0A0E4G9R8_9FIRM|nr:pro-sigmaK processing inhibitor BofA family protein [Syntrophomonas zehnderi]CFX23307.1 SigmaK-factor processing regulatory BofA [Syntrophomonas zehnderi OL-4]